MRKGYAGVGLVVAFLALLAITVTALLVWPDSAGQAGAGKKGSGRSLAAGQVGACRVDGGAGGTESKLLIGKEPVGEGAPVDARKGPTLLVKVWRKSESGSLPAAGAEVVLEQVDWSGSRSQGVFSVGAGDKDLGEEWSRKPRRFRTGQEGAVAVPFPRAASATSLYCHIWAEGADPGVTSERIRLQWDHSGRVWSRDPWGWRERVYEVDLFLVGGQALRFEVRDGEGNPVPQVPVGLYHSLSGPRNSSNLVLKGSSGPTGIGTMGNALAVMRSLSGSGKGRVAFDRWYLRFRIPRSDMENDFHPLRAANFTDTPVVMVMPRTTRVVFRVDRGVKGCPVEHGLMAIRNSARKRDLFGDDWAGGPVGFSRRWIRRHSVPIVHGRAVFPFVGYGLDLELLVMVPGVMVYDRAVITGPRFGESQGTVTYHHLVRAKDRQLRLRLLGEDGKVFANSSIRVGFSTMADPARLPNRADFCPVAMTTDADGRVSLPLPPEVYKYPAEARGRYKAALLEASVGGVPTAAAMLSLPGPYPEGVTDLGDLVMAALPVVAQGVVLHHDGRPAADTTVWAYRRRNRKSSDWTNVWSTETDQKGRFALRKVWNWPEVKLLAFAIDKSAFSDYVQVCPGATGLRMTLKRAGQISGSIKVGDPSWLARCLVNVYLRRVGGKKSFFHSPRKQVDRDGRFRFTAVPQGVYHFYLKSGYLSGDTLAQIPDLQVNPQAGLSRELPCYDLTDVLEAVEIECLGEDGSPLEAGPLFGTGLPRLQGVSCQYFNREKNSICFLKRRGRPVQGKVLLKGHASVSINVDRPRLSVTLRKE